MVLAKNSLEIKRKILERLTDDSLYPYSKFYLCETKKDLDISTGEFWYDLTDGGYLKLEEMLENKEDVEKLKEAINVVKDFQNSCEEQIEGFIQ